MNTKKPSATAKVDKLKNPAGDTGVVISPLTGLPLQKPYPKKTSVPRSQIRKAVLKVKSRVA